MTKKENNINAIKHALMNLENTDEDKIKETLIDILKLPKNYNQRLKGQIKRYANKKPPEELTDLIINEWGEYESIIKGFVEGISELSNEIFHIFITTLGKAEHTLNITETKIEIVNKSYEEKLKMSYLEFKKNLVIEYIDMGVSPDKAVDIVMDSSISDEEMVLKKIFDDVWDKHTNNYY